MKRMDEHLLKEDKNESIRGHHSVDVILSNNSNNQNIKNNEDDIYLSYLSPIITAVGNFSVQYNFQAIGIALYVMSEVECTMDDVQCQAGHQKSWVGGNAQAVIFAGAIFGQLTMGYAGDVLGRTKAMIVTLSLATLGALLSSSASVGSAASVYSTIIITRFFLGVGLGGVYPLSATKAAEDGASQGNNNKSNKVDPSSAAKAFFWQAPGAMGPWLIALLYTISNNDDVNAEWRLILGLGAIPTAFSVCCAITEDYIKRHKPKSIQIASSRSNSSPSLWVSLSDKQNLFKLLITGGTWYLYDIVFYGVSVFGGKIVKSIDNQSVQNDVVNNIDKIAGQNLIALFMGIPATLLSIYAIKRIGTRKLQVLGFIIIGLFLFLFAGLYNYCEKNNHNNALFGVYCLLLFSLNFGPNVTTYVLPAQTYPKDIRSTFNGISAAMGKLGAVTGCYLFNIQNFVLIMVLGGFISLLGALLSLFINEEEPGEEEKSLNNGDETNETRNIIRINDINTH